MRRLYRYYFVTILTFGFALGFSQNSLALVGGELADSALVVALTPENLAVLKDKNPETHSLQAVKNGKLVPIPFQFDEMTENGFVYMDDSPDKFKKKDPLLGKAYFFDGNDQLLFMMKDAGARKTSAMQVEGQMLAEIAVENHKGQKRYVYLVKDSVLESEEFYVRFSGQLGRVETDYYALKVDPDNAFMWEEFYYDSFNGANPGRPFDTITLRMYSNALALIPLNMNNKHMVAKLVSEKSGPIRSTTQYKVVLTYLKAPIMNFDLQIVHHEQAISYNSQVEIPAVRRRLVSKAAMNASVDGYNLNGAEVYVSNGPAEPGIVDGHTSKVEEEMVKVEFKTNEPSWVLLDSKSNFSFVNHFIVETDEEIPMGVMYEEHPDREMPPEYFKGQMPMVGFMMHRNPMKGTMTITNQTLMFNGSPGMEVQSFVGLAVRSPKVTVTPLK